MLKRFTLASFTAFSLLAAGPPREITSQATLDANQLVPALSNGYLYFLDQSAVRVYSPDGHLAFATVIKGHSPSTQIQGLAADSDGTVAVSWTTSDFSSAGIDLLDANGSKTGSIDTAAYVPSHLAFAADHSLWTLGWQEHTPDYLIVRHFSSGGTQVGAWLPRSSFPHGLEPGGPAPQGSRISLARDRVGILAYSGMTGAQQEWIELNFDGSLIGRWTAPENVNSQVALTTDGQVYTQTGPTAQTSQLLTLDRPGSNWQPVPSVSGKLYGADANQLVFADRKLGPMHLRWVNQPTAPVNSDTEKEHLQ